MNDTFRSQAQLLPIARWSTTVGCAMLIVSGLTLLMSFRFGKLAVAIVAVSQILQVAIAVAAILFGQAVSSLDSAQVITTAHLTRCFRRLGWFFLLQLVPVFLVLVVFVGIAWFAFTRVGF